MKRVFLLFLMVCHIIGFSQTMTFSNGASEPGFTFNGWSSDSSTIWVANLASTATVTKDVGTWNFISFVVGPFVGANTMQVESNLGDIYTYNTSTAGKHILVWMGITSVTFSRISGSGASADHDDFIYTVDSVICNNPTIPAISCSPATVCNGNNVILNITGSLNDAIAWKVYSGSCGGTLVGSTATSSIVVSPSYPGLAYYVRGEGACVIPGACGSTTVVVNNSYNIQIDTTICYGDSVFVGGQYQTSSGVYVDSLQSVDYCDSLIYTNLIIMPLALINLGSDTIINIGDSINLNAGLMFTSYLWSDGSNGQSLTVKNAGVYWVQVTSNIGCISSDTIIIGVGYTLNGKLTYANTATTGMNNTKVVLKELPNNKVDSIILGVNGVYQYNNLWNANYTLIPVITKTWGGINSTDALAIMKHFVGLNYLQGLYLKAGDVDATSYINSADALMTQKRYIGMISGFPAGDWTWEDNNIIIYGINVNYDFQTICMGDVNGSYIPPLAMQEPKLTLIPHNELTIGSFQSFEMPFAVNEQLEVGAISLTLDYPSEYLIVEDVKLGNGESKGLLYAENNGELRISWYNLESYNLRANEPILLIKFKAKDLSGVNSNKLSFIAKGSSELADSDAKVIRNVKLYIPKLRVINSPDGYSLSPNFPNPFKSVTEIEYSLKEAGNVNLKVFNVLGVVVSEIVSKYQAAGHYRVKFEGSNYSEGLYFYKISVTANIDDFSQSRVMVISR